MKSLDGDARVYMVNFKCGAILGAVREDENGFASIYIEDQCSPQGRRRVFRHELKHIENDDFHNDKDITEVEK